MMNNNSMMNILGKKSPKKNIKRESLVTGDDENEENESESIMKRKQKTKI